MRKHHLFLIAAAVCAALYLWPSQSIKVAKKVGDTTISAVKSGIDEAKK